MRTKIEGRRMRKAVTNQKADNADVEGLEELLVSEVDTPSVDPGHNVNADWSLSEAAEAFEVNQRTVRRWIKQQRLTAWKVDGPRGPEWRIQAGATLGNHPAPTPPAVDVQAADKLVDIVSELTNQLTKANDQLAAASFRIGYLEAQAEAHQEQIKLLTDSQHKRGRWSRFWSWFTTG